MSIDFEKNPLNSEAEYGLNVTSQSVEVVYHEVNFFKLEFIIKYSVYITLLFSLFSLLFLHYLVSFIIIKKLTLNLLLKNGIKQLLLRLKKYSIQIDPNQSLENFY